MIGANENSLSVNVSKCRGGGGLIINSKRDFTIIFVSMIFVDSVLQ